ncbi:hypothetical protein EMIT07CA2_60263 [Brevibacillus sp. IT-7CA2]|uniref:hypothetical protein n=1 Tax=Brevibacillus sp. IT-7CA2 TaxID=3026436 RepID=UPI0039DFDA80
MATQPITIGANSIARIGDRFFLIVEVEAKAPGVEIDPVFAVRTFVLPPSRSS